MLINPVLLKKHAFSAVALPWIGLLPKTTIIENCHASQFEAGNSIWFHTLASI